MDAGSSWPSKEVLDELRETVAEMTGRSSTEVRVVVSPYRICPLGAHIDHQGGLVSAMAINLGILLAFVPSGNSQVVLRSKQFRGEVQFRVDEVQHPIKSEKAIGCMTNGQRAAEECSWGRYARAALYALQSRGKNISQGITGVICGSKGLDSSGLSSSAAVGIAYLLAFESANKISVSPTENIEYDRLIENEYLGLNNGILDQSAILLSSYGCLTFMDCKTKEYKLILPPEPQKIETNGVKKAYKILLACSGLKHALTSNKGYNSRVAECREAAKVLLSASGQPDMEPILSNVDLAMYEAHKGKLNPLLARRAEHYFSENIRVKKGLEAWSSGNLNEFGKLITSSGQSSIHNYECGCEPLIQLYEVLLRTPGIFGARFSGAGFRGCCIALVDAESALEAASYVRTEYAKLQPELANKIDPETAVLICDSSDSARII
ncbi:hypothetical protein V2J09_010291 [Rumex salicifolius]